MRGEGIEFDAVRLEPVIPPPAIVTLQDASTDRAPVEYQQIVDAMSVGRTTGLTKIDVVDPRQLTTVPVPASGG